MKRGDLGMGIGLAALLAVCCGGKLLLAIFAAPALALLTGQALVVAAATIVALLAVGIFLRRLPGRRERGARPPRQTARAMRSRREAGDLEEVPR
jgi:hypothetical protein